MDWLYRNLRRTRPAQLAVFLKSILQIKRRVTQTSTGHRFWIDPVSHFGGEVLETGIYEPVLTQLLNTLLRPNDIFVDVGANEGYFSVLASGLVGQSGQVFSVEPQSRLIPVIRKNLNLLREDRHLDNVTLVQEALADHEGETVLHLTPMINSGAASFYRHWRFGAGEERVHTSTLDEFFRSRSLDRVRLIKLDCEGAELSIVNGARKTLSEKKADFVSIDFHPGIAGEEAPLKIDEHLRKSGYHLSQAGTGIWVYHLPGLDVNLQPLGVPKEIPPLAA